MDTDLQGNKPEWITYYKDAQKITGLSRTTLWKCASEGRIVASRQGRAVRLLRTSLDELMWREVWTTEAGANPSEGTPAQEEPHPLEDGS